MRLLKKTIGGVSAGFLFSALLHAGVGGGLYVGLMREKNQRIVADLDLSMMPLAPRPANAGGGRAAKPEASWTLPKKGKAPAPPVAPENAPEPAAEPEETAPCPEPCNETGTGDGGGGSGEGAGLYVPAEQTTRKPRWLSNFITSRDYPRIARQEGKDGRVVLTVLIDAEGRVRDARLLQGAYEALNEVALRKVREAVFSPAYGSDGKPVACLVTLPIRFELR